MWASKPRTRIRVAASASAAIFGPARSAGVKSHTIFDRLRGGGKDSIGYGALRWQEMVGTDEVLFGKLRELRYLPKKIANFLHEFRAGDFPSLNLPPLP